MNGIDEMSANLLKKYNNKLKEVRKNEPYHCCANCANAGILQIKTVKNIKGALLEIVDSKAASFNCEMRVCLIDCKTYLMYEHRKCAGFSPDLSIRKFYRANNKEGI